MNKVIRAVLNSLFFYKKIWHTHIWQKALKSTKRTKTTNQHKDTQAKAQKRKQASK